MDGIQLTQQVNLYLPEFRPRHDWLTLERLGVLMLVFVLALGSLSGYDFWRRYSLTQELTALQTTLASQTSITEQFEATLAQRATDQTLRNEVVTREESLAELNGTLATLRTVALGNVNGFSEHLKNVSRSSFDGLWFTEIRITDGGNKAYLTGHALESPMVPNFVDRLTSGWVTADGWKFNRILGQMGEIAVEVPEDELTEADVVAAAEAARAERIATLFEQARGPQTDEEVAAEADAAAEEEAATPEEAYPDSYQFILETL